MKNFFLDKDTNDLVLDNFNLRLSVNDTEYYSQKIENTIKVNYGEYFLDRTIGVPYYGPNGLIMSKNPDLNEVEAILLAAIVGIDGINNVEKFEVTFNQATRVYKAEIRAMTDSGIAIEGEINL